MLIRGLPFTLLSDYFIIGVIDTTTFKYLGVDFYGDKNHIYIYYFTTDGGSFYIVEEADVKSFKIIRTFLCKR